jgi:peptidoglycan/LPS O-acetylase OafA/YrhL
LLDSKNRTHFYRRFYTRRVLRILPAYYSLLIFLLLLHSSSPAFVGLSFIYLANVTNFFGVACGYGPLWSLAVEEHFYIVWPAVAHRVTRERLAWISAAIVVAVPILRAISFIVGWRSGLAWYTWFVADGLAAGALLAILLRTSITRRQVKRVCGLLLGFALILAVAGTPFGILTRDRILGAALQWTTIHALFAGILLLFLLAGSSSAKQYVNLSLLRFFGYISYGLYLDHLLAFRMYDRLCRHYFPQFIPSSGHFELVVLKFIVAGGAAVGIAYLSRRFFEEKFLRLKDSFEPKSPALGEPAIVSDSRADAQFA